MRNKLTTLGLVWLWGASMANAATNQLPATNWNVRFETLVFPVVPAETARAGTNLGGNIAWGPAYQMAALVEMLNVTRDSKYAEQFVRLGDWVAAARDDRHALRDEVRGGSFPAWSTTGYSEGKRYIWAVHTGTIAAPLARFAAIVRHDPALQSRWQKEADRLLQVAEAAVAVHDAEYRDGPQADEGYVYCPYLKKPLPLNMQNALAQTWLAIDDANRTAKYSQQVKRLAQFTRNRLRPMEDGSYVWAYWPPLEGTDTSAEDISHAAGNLNFMLRCQEHGIVFQREDVARLEKTLLTRVLQTDGRIADTVNGAGEFNHYRSAVLRWGRLAKHSPKVREKLREFSQQEEFAADALSLPLTLVYLIGSTNTPAGK